MTDDDKTAQDAVDAAGILSEALEYADRARGHLYAFHQLTGRSDLLLGDAADALRSCGHADLADRLEEELVGRNVIADRWTFQIVEDYDDNYWEPFRAFEKQVRDELTGGERHLHEARLKEQRRTHGHPAHQSGPRLED
ncbi:MAG TPA: hypothetical protein VFM09_15270 [Marmoricola sp.]|nr:hypothetical protein [Marmoricola sp.]